MYLNTCYLQKVQLDVTTYKSKSAIQEDVVSSEWTAQFVCEL